MALEIKENRGIFELIGKVTSQNMGAVRIYFENEAESTDQMVISLERVSYLDASAAKFFERFYRKMASGNKAISIIGKQNREVVDVMNLTKTDYILSSDRV